MLRTATQSAQDTLDEILAERIMVLDGSMGALIYSREPTEEDYRGVAFARHPSSLKNCTEVLNLTQPKLIEEIHRAYLDAGADIIETNTFNGNALSLEEFGLEHHVADLNRAAVEIARRAADEFTRRDPGKPRFVAASIGPTKKQLSMGIHVDDPGRRDVTFDQMVLNYKDQIRALIDAGADILLPETSFDTLVMKACLFAMEEVFDEIGHRVPVMVSGTIFDNGATLSAQPPEAFYLSVSHFDALSVGLNCAVGVDQMRPALGEPGADQHRADQLLPQRRHARRLRRLPGGQAAHRRGARRVRPPRLAEPRRRLLRDHAGMDQRHRRGRPRRAPAARPRVRPALGLLRHPTADRPPRVELPDGRRADQHHRLAQVRPSHQGIQFRRGRRRRPRPGRGRRQHDRRQR